jgi:hypothetical protein
MMRVELGGLGNTSGVDNEIPPEPQPEININAIANVSGLDPALSRTFRNGGSQAMRR